MLIFFFLGDEKGMKKFITALTAEDSENDAAMANVNKRHRESLPQNHQQRNNVREMNPSQAAPNPPNLLVMLQRNMN